MQREGEVTELARWEVAQEKTFEPNHELMVRPRTPMSAPCSCPLSRYPQAGDSGGAGKVLVAQGNVSVDGQPELRKTCKIRSGQVVSIGNVRITVT